MHKIKFIINTGIKMNNVSDGTIQNINNSCHMHISDDLAKYVLSLEKSIIYVFKQNIKNLALASNDQIFKLISVEFMKRIFNEGVILSFFSLFT